MNNLRVLNLNELEELEEMICLASGCNNNDEIKTGDYSCYLPKITNEVSGNDVVYIE